MGNCGSINHIPQILVLGLEGSGKTTFVFGDKYEDFEPTLGFNYEETKLNDILKVGIWDVSGKLSLKCLWPMYYRNIELAGIVYVVDCDDQENFSLVIQDINLLVNEEELRLTPFLFVFNKKSTALASLEDLCRKLGMNSFSPSTVWKAVVTNLTQEDEELTSATLWLVQKIMST